MSDDHVINIKNTLKARQLLEFFDNSLDRLNEHGLDKNENQTDILELLAGSLEEAIENGTKLCELEQRANELAHYALENGYSVEEVETLLTMHPNPNGNRTPQSYQ